MEESLALLRAGKVSELRKRAKDALKKDKMDPEAWFMLGMAAQHEGQRPHAIECFERALYVKPDPKYYRAKASVHMESFEFEQAVEELQEALDIKEDADSLFLLAICMLFLDSPDAARYMHRAHQLDKKRTKELLRDFFLRFFKDDKGISDKEKKRLWAKISS
ncbi:MAG: tetratricopeptide repeat protein [Candidatus ainarchaeum sp.]|nr:tetratricopeptide repeat protein [Candidatus ainarchaeum sp.]MDD5096786.1 tetratricopeptide repeat protein [Candidatus ainarchaeum sp.]